MFYEINLGPKVERWYAKLDFSRTNEWVVNKNQIQPQLIQLQELLA